MRAGERNGAGPARARPNTHARVTRNGGRAEVCVVGAKSPSGASGERGADSGWRADRGRVGVQNEVDEGCCDALCCGGDEDGRWIGVVWVVVDKTDTAVTFKLLNLSLSGV